MTMTTLESLKELVDTMQAAIKRIEIANAEGNPILSAWLPDAQAAIANATKIVEQGDRESVLVSVLKSAENWFGELGNDDGAQGLLDDIRDAIANAERI
jgi:hypothetical protein